ncbi:hypothetical protein SLS60_011027 [Paraconiothyrium brasiliense]|uniref:Heme haloperoxidase family profile domain-containing protein n=1 Tax=Paraconiothyrium brasiliense TaxID=300254 RepID=A0ABR3QKC9_9PLEO
MNKVFGMGVDLGTALAVMGTVWVGNPLSLSPGFSIGGPTSKSSNILGNLVGLLGAPQGIKYSHNFIESDSSPTRNDLYTTGNAWTMNVSLFEDLYGRADATTGIINFETIAEFAKVRFHQTIAENPNFYYGPFTGMIARNAGYLFTARIFRNHSMSHPEGALTKEILKSFFAVTEDENGALSYNEGWERIPENWYKTPVDYGLVQLNLDTVALASLHPELASIGGNTGTVNSFTGVDISNITGGILNVQTLLSGNNLLCLAFEVIKTVSPGALSTIYKTLAVPLQMITDALAAPLLDLGCPAFEDMRLGGTDIFKELAQLYPGANRTGGGV